MPYAVVQLDLTGPTEEQLVEAVRATSCLCAADARRIARQDFGIIVEGIGAEDAGALASALVGQGVKVKAIDQDALPSLPPVKITRRIECRADMLLIDDALGRPSEWRWDQVQVLAAGDVESREEIVEETPAPPRRRYEPRSAWVSTRTHHMLDTSQPLLELHVDGAPNRFRARPEEAAILCLGEQRAPAHRDSLPPLLRDIAQLAPHALINRGMALLGQNPKMLRYRSHQAFEKELIWLRWWGNSGASGMASA